MITEMATILTGLIPASIGKFSHLIVAALSSPILMCIDVDTYCYGVLPVVIEVCQQYGVAASAVGIAAALTSSCVMMQPYSAGFWLALSLADDMSPSEYYRSTLKLIWGICTFMLLMGIVIGLPVW